MIKMIKSANQDHPRHATKTQGSQGFQQKRESSLPDWREVEAPTRNSSKQKRFPPVLLPSLVRWRPTGFLPCDGDESVAFCSELVVYKFANL